MTTKCEHINNQSFAVLCVECKLIQREKQTATKILGINNQMITNFAEQNLKDGYIQGRASLLAFREVFNSKIRKEFDI